MSDAALGDADTLIGPPRPNLVRNTIWSLVGYIVPLPLALVAFPILTQALGADRFGVLSLAWALIGYSGIFDLGLGRALTKVVSERLPAAPDEVPALIWSTMTVMVLIGSLSVVAMFLLAPTLVDAVFKVPPELHLEAMRSFQIVAVTLPLITTSAGMRGILEAQQRFRAVGVMNSITWSLMLVAPLVTLPFGRSLVLAMAALLVSRLLTWCVYLGLCVIGMPALWPPQMPRLRAAGPTLRFGGWLTVSNIIGPFLTYFDRFVIGALLSVGAVTYYTVPYDMVLRIGIVASAVCSVLFPVFSANYQVNRAVVLQTYQWGLRVIGLAATPLALAALLLAPEGLSLWLGPAFAEESTALLRWLAVGVFVNCLAQAPSGLIQGSGRPDLTARLHALEVLPYLGLLWVLVTHRGITGAALAWSLRATVDALLILAVCHSVFPEGRQAAKRLLMPIGVAWLLGLALSGNVSFEIRVACWTIFVLCYPPVVWIWGLTRAERHTILSSGRALLHHVPGQS
ncbi:MAG: flippase [Thermomicrobiales bacterium]